MQEKTLVFPEPEQTAGSPAFHARLHAHAQEEGRYGSIVISTQLMHTLNIPQIDISHTDTQGQLAEKGVFQQLHTALQLPADYTIEAIYFQYMRRLWVIFILSPHLSPVEMGAYPPQYTLVYRIDCRVEEGEDLHPPVFLRMEPLDPCSPYTDRTEYVW